MINQVIDERKLFPYLSLLSRTPPLLPLSLPRPPAPAPAPPTPPLTLAAAVCQPVTAPEYAAGHPLLAHCYTWPVIDLCLGPRWVS
jgi:hypothetical protein